MYAPVALRMKPNTSGGKKPPRPPNAHSVDEATSKAWQAEILPTGWTWPEVRFGEFTRLMGGLHWNPQVRVKAIAMRRDPVYYALHMPWENIWVSAPIYEAAALRVRLEQ